MADQMIIVTQRRGLSHKPEAQRLILKGLGLRRVNHTVTVRDTPAIRGMIIKVQHLVDIEVKVGLAPLTGARAKKKAAAEAAAQKSPKTSK